MSMKRISYRETLPLLRHFTKSESLNFKTESCQSKFNLFFSFWLFVCPAYLKTWATFSNNRSQNCKWWPKISLFPRARRLCCVFPYLALVLCYSAFDARAPFFRTWGSCCVSPHLALHCVSRAWRPCCVFRAWRSCYVFPRLALELCFLYVALCWVFLRLAPVLCSNAPDVHALHLFLLRAP